MSLVNEDPRQLIWPSTLAVAQPTPKKYASLARKIYFFGDRTAFAVSGKETHIKEFLRLAKEEVLKIDEKSKRPVRHLADLASSFSDLGIIGAYVGENGNHIIFPRETFNCQNLDMCAVAGSGGANLSAWIEKWDHSLDSWPHRNPFEIIRGLGQGLANYKLFSEALFDKREDYWGGYIENCFFDFGRMRWRMGFPVVQYIGLFLECGFEKFSSGLHNQSFAYFPNKNFSLLRSFDSHEGVFNDWIFEDLREGFCLDRYNKYIIKAWRFFRPSSATITFLPPRGFNLEPVTISTDWHERNNVRWKITDSVRHVGIENELWDRLSQMACSAWGVEYVPRAFDGGTAW